VRLELVHFEASDGLVLPGLLYEPERRSRRAIVWLHGNGDASVFYAERTNPLARAFTAAGVAFFPFNNRGAHLVKRLTRAGGRRKSVTRGTTYERIRESIADIEGAVRMMRSRGYDEIILAGHSSGANKICVYNFYRRRNRVSRYILLGAGDDTGLYLANWGARKFERVLELCRRRIAEGKRSEIAPLELTPFPLSWASLYDTINPEGDYNIFPFFPALNGKRISRKSPFREFRAIARPALVMFGSGDEFCFDNVRGCVEILMREVADRDNFSFEILEDADHGFHGREDELAAKILRWLSRRPAGSGVKRAGRSG
jgi:pimeloyl-ACP methyl ester carboxylesterase